MDNFSASSLNVFSLSSLSRRLLFNQYLNCNRSKIWFLQETKLNYNIIYSIRNFNIFRNDRQYGYGGGVAIVLDRNILTRGFKTFNQGLEAVSVEALLNDVWVQLVSCYIPPTVKPDSSTTSSFASFLNNNLCLLGGDWNAKDLSFGDSYGNITGRWLVDFGFMHRFRIINPISPTCHHSINGSFIDKFLSRNILTQLTCSVIPSFSDHFQICTQPVFTVSDVVSEVGGMKCFSWTKITKFNKFVLKEVTNLGLPINRNVSTTEIEGHICKVNAIFNEAIDRYVPTTKTNHDKIKLSSTTLAIKQVYRSKLRHFKRNPFLPNSAIVKLKSELNLIKKLMLENIKIDISNFYNNILVDTNNVYTFHGLVGRKKNAGKFKPINFISDSAGILVQGESNICNTLAEHFANNHTLSYNHSSIYENPVNNFVNNFKSDTYIAFSDNCLALPSCDGIADNDIRVSTNTVLEIINSRKNKSAVGLDKIPNRLLKMLDVKILDTFAIIFNHLLALGYFPECWKNALVIPIPKAGKDLSITSNWRPISLLSCLSKIYERVVAERLKNFANENNSIPNHQFGFRAGHSTCHPLGLLQNKINSGLNSNKITTMVCLDIRAAFDTVWHNGLLFKLNRLKFPNYIISIISKFLIDRSFIVKLGNSYSVPKQILAGVPQGSVLGPILFNVSNYDIPLAADFDLLQFADDTAVAISYDSARGIENKINKYLFTLNKWYYNWKFILSEGKSELIHFVGSVRHIGPGRRRTARNFNININGIKILHTKSINYLGVQFSANNRFNVHVNQALIKFQKAKNIIGYLMCSQLINVRFKRLLYTVYLRPILSYAAPVWLNPSNISSHQVERLRIVERKTIRQVYNVHRPRNSYKYLSNKKLYEIYDYKRLDSELVNLSINFHQANLYKSNPLINSLTNKYSVICANDNNYKRTDFIYNLKLNNMLLNENSHVTLFNKAAFMTNRNVYSLDQ